MVVDSNPRKAKEVLDRGLEVSPRHPSLHHLYGQILGQEEKYAEAIPHLETAITAAADFPEDVVALDALHYTLAGALLMSGQVDKGLSHLKRTLSINPRNFMALNDLGLVHEQLGQLEEAVKYYQQALEVEPNFTPAVENLKRVKQRMGNS